jgi:anti-sigma factor RsiW
MSAGGDECFTDFAVQEYLGGRLEPSVRQELEAHLSACAECRAATTALDAELRILRAALSPIDALEPRGNTYDDEALARYLDGALDEGSVQVFEERLSRDPALLTRLIALRREVLNVRQEAELGAPEEKPEPLGQILRMPKRIAPIRTVVTEKRTGEASGA